MQWKEEKLLQGQVNKRKETLNNLEVPARDINEGLDTELNNVFGIISNVIETLKDFEKKFNQHKYRSGPKATINLTSKEFKYANL